MAGATVGALIRRAVDAPLKQVGEIINDYVGGADPAPKTKSQKARKAEPKVVDTEGEEA